MSFPVLYLWPLAPRPLSLEWYAGSLTGWLPAHLGSAPISPFLWVVSLFPEGVRSSCATGLHM